MNKLPIKENISLKNYLTLQSGGIARYFYELRDTNELIELVQFSKEKNVDIFILGGGSNIVAHDGPLNFLVIRMLNTAILFDGNIISACAGENWDDVVKASVEAGFSGIESLSGIPGTAGAAPIQNIGAYGTELKDTFHCLEAFDIVQMKFIKFYKSDCSFGYRKSIWKGTFPERYIITKIYLELTKNNLPQVSYPALKNYFSEKRIIAPTIIEVREAVLEIRKQKLPDPKIIPNAGSFFKNPIVDSDFHSNLKIKFPNIVSFAFNDYFKLSAGWMIEQLGFKDRPLGKIVIHKNNALVLTNPMGGNYMDIVLARDIIKNEIFSRFGVELEQEPDELVNL